MFKPLSPDAGPAVSLAIDGRIVTVASGISVAAALLQSADGQTRTTPVTGAPRAPYCLMGVCFDCLVEIDGVPNRQACMVTVHEGMRVIRADGARTVQL